MISSSFGQKPDTNMVLLVDHHRTDMSSDTRTPLPKTVTLAGYFCCTVTKRLPSLFKCFQPVGTKA